MIRRKKQEILDWHERPYRGRAFVYAKVPDGDNRGKSYTVAKAIADRYEVKRFFASGGCGLLLEGRDRQTETEVLIKTTLRYETSFYAKGRDREGFTEKLQQGRRQLQTERRIMVLLKNQGCNAIPNPNDYVFDWNPSLEGPHATEDGGKWCYDDEAMLSSEPYLIQEAIEGETLESLLGEDLNEGMEEQRALAVMRQVTNVLAVLHQPMRVGGVRWELVYQDLKPANILLGAHDYVALVDLGGCRLLVDGKFVMAGASTLGYCPPECDQAVNPGLALTPAVDSYTVGSTLFHLLTGRSPVGFLPPGVAGIGPKSVSYDRWDWPRLWQKARKETFEFIRRCLSHNPRDRPLIGAELHEEMERLLR